MKMASQPTSGQSSGTKPTYKVACLLVIVLTVTWPLHAVACPMSACSSANSESNIQCHAMEMPKQSTSSCAVSSCCQQDQMLAQTVQRDVGPQVLERTVAASLAEDP